MKLTNEQEFYIKQTVKFRNKETIKNETNFAKAIITRYKMANTKNKTFVNAMIIDIIEIEKYFNLDKLIDEIHKLDFITIGFEDEENVFAVVKKNETRKLRFTYNFTVAQFL